MTLGCRGGTQFSAHGSMLVQVLMPAVLAVIALAAGPAGAQESGQQGIDVFEAVCATCHLKGDNGAPRIGDRIAWAQRARQGLAGLTQSAMTGIRKMPAHGGDTSLSRLELQRAIVYIVNESGGNWAEPVSTEKTANRSTVQIVRVHCALCHDSGFDNAPRIGDRAAWAKSTALGIDRLVRITARGHGGMPPRGGEAGLSDAELRGAVIYMASSARARAAAERKAVPAGAVNGKD